MSERHTIRCAITSPRQWSWWRVLNLPLWPRNYRILHIRNKFARFLRRPIFVTPRSGRELITDSVHKTQTIQRGILLLLCLPNYKVNTGRKDCNGGKGKEMVREVEHLFLCCWQRSDLNNLPLSAERLARIRIYAALLPELEVGFLSGKWQIVRVSQEEPQNVSHNHRNTATQQRTVGPRSMMAES
jgi:hypothetical protein